MSYTDHSVKQEIVMLSRYKGLRSSRFLTVLLSLCSINTLYPAGILFTLTGLMLPLMITFAAPEQKKKEPLTQLSSLMRQYRFNTIRFTATGFRKNDANCRADVYRQAADPHP